MCRHVTEKNCFSPLTLKMMVIVQQSVFYFLLISKLEIRDDRHILHLSRSTCTRLFLMSDDGVSNKKTADTTGASLTVFSHTSTNPTMNDPPDFTIFYPSEVKSSQSINYIPHIPISYVVSSIDIHGDQRTQDTDESGTIVESKEQQPVITNSVLEGESWLITYFEHRTPLELVQVKDSDGIIPLDSAWIKTEEISLDSSYKRKVSIQRRRMFDSYDLIMRESSESLIQWKCVLKNTTEGISSDMERDYSGAIAEASQELPSSKTSSVVCNDSPFLLQVQTPTTH